MRCRYTSIFVLWFLGFFFLSEENLWAQSGDPESVFMLTGVSMKPYSNLRAFGYLGYNPDLGLKIVNVHAQLTLNKYLSIDPGYMHVTAPKVNGKNADEHIFLSTVNLSAPLGPVLLEDRNMLWNRFRNNLADLHFYRNRLRVVYPAKILGRAFTAYAYDEGFYGFSASRWTRNRLALGATVDYFKWLSMDISYARQRDLSLPNTNIFFLIATIPLEHLTQKNN